MAALTAAQVAGLDTTAWCEPMQVPVVLQAAAIGGGTSTMPAGW